jgi:hypothetical protein
MRPCDGGALPLAGAGAGGGPWAGPAPAPIPSKGWELDDTWAPTADQLLRDQSCADDVLQAVRDVKGSSLYNVSELMAIAQVHSLDQRSVMIGMKQVGLPFETELDFNGCVALWSELAKPAGCSVHCFHGQF